MDSAFLYQQVGMAMLAALTEQSQISTSALLWESGLCPATRDNDVAKGDSVIDVWTLLSASAIHSFPSNFKEI